MTDCNKHNQQSGLWIYGILLAIASSICTNLGVNLQKYSFICELKRKVQHKRGYFRQPLWSFGLFLVIFGSLGDFAALGFIPQSLAIPVGGTTILANVIFAHYLLKEAFTRRDMIATILIITGILLVATFAAKESKCYTLRQLIRAYHQSMFILYATFMGVLSIIMFLGAKYLDNLFHSFGRKSPKYLRYAEWHPCIYPALSGIIGAQSTLLAKSVAELFKMTLEGDNQFYQFGVYLISLGMFSSIFLQIHYLAMGLQRFDAVYIVPVFQCFFISVSILGGAAYFDEFSTMTLLQISMFILGVIITLSGVYILSKRRMNLLTPIKKFKSGVYSIIYIKRCQKLRGYNHKWIIPNNYNNNSNSEASIVKVRQSYNSLDTTINTTISNTDNIAYKNCETHKRIIKPIGFFNRWQCNKTVVHPSGK